MSASLHGHLERERMELGVTPVMEAFVGYSWMLHPHPTFLSLSPAHTSSTALHDPPPQFMPTLLHLLTEMSDASDLKGASWLHILIFEEDGHACHLRQCPALQQRSDSMERLSPDVLHQSSLHSCGTQTTCKGARIRFLNYNREGKVKATGPGHPIFNPASKLQGPWKCLPISGP